VSECSRLTLQLGFALSLLLGSEGALADTNQEFVDSDGVVRSFDREYEAWIDFRKPRYPRAAAEVAILTAIGTFYYLVDPLSTETDFDDPSLAAKLRFQAISFDNNLTSTNFILHPLAGALMYDFSRTNGLPFYSAFAYTAASSIAFEFFLEYREQVSINDLIFTPFGGMALGEFLFRLGDYVTSAPGGGGFGNSFAAYTLGLPQQLHRKLDHTKLPRTGLPPDNLGFSSAYWHRFFMSYGFGGMVNGESESGTVSTVELGAALAAMPGLLKNGRFDMKFDQGNFTDGYARMLVNGDGAQEIDLQTSTILFGYFTQDVDVRRGIAQAAGGGTALRFYDSWRLGERDGYYFVRPIQPVLRFWVRAGEIVATGHAETSIDFAGIRPLAYQAFALQHGTDGLKSVLTKQGYVFAACLSGRLNLGFEYAWFNTAVHSNVGYCRSIQGLDREQDSVTRDLPTGDLIVELNGFLGARLSKSFELRAQIDSKIRQGSMGPVSDSTWNLHSSGVFSYLF
jgi:Domain of unknown function (DUF3943)